MLVLCSTEQRGSKRKRSRPSNEEGAGIHRTPAPPRLTGRTKSSDGTLWAFQIRLLRTLRTLHSKIRFRDPDRSNPQGLLPGTTSSLRSRTLMLRHLLRVTANRARLRSGSITHAQAVPPHSRGLADARSGRVDWLDLAPCLDPLVNPLSHAASRKSRRERLLGSYLVPRPR